MEFNLNNSTELCRMNSMRHRRYPKMLGVVVGMGLQCLYGHLHAGEPSRVELVLETIKIQPAAPHAQSVITATASVRNDGSQSVENMRMTAVLKRNGKAQMQYDDIPVISSLSRSSSGYSVPVKLGSLPPGDYELTMVIFPPKDILEAELSNNRKAVRFKVTTASISRTY